MPGGHADGLADDLDARGLVACGHLDLVQRRQAPEERHAAARDDTFLDGGPCGVEGILDEGLPLFHFDLGGGPDTDLGDAARQLRQPLLQLLAVVVAGGRLDFAANHVDAALDGGGVAGAFHDRRVIIVDGDLLGGAQVVQTDVFQFDAQVLHDGPAAGQRGDVLEHGLAPVAVAGRLDGRALEDAAQLVDDQGGQRLALDVLGDNQQRPPGLRDPLQQRHQVLGARDFLLKHQDERPLQHALHPVRVGHEMRAHVPAVELHALDHLDLGGKALALLDRDDAVLANLRERVGQHLADLGVAVGADAGNLGHLVGLGDVDTPGDILEPGHDALDGLLHAARQSHRVGPRGDVPQGLLEQGLGNDGGGGGAVARHVARLGGRLLHELGAHVLALVAEVDFLGHGHAVLGDRRRAPALVEDGVATPRPQGRLDRAGQFLDAGKQPAPRLLLESQDLGWHADTSPFRTGDPLES